MRLSALLCLAASLLTVAADVLQTDPRSHLEPSRSTGGDGHHGNGSVLTGIPVVTLKWHHVQEPYQVALWILVAGVCKQGRYGCRGDGGSSRSSTDGEGGERVSKDGSSCLRTQEKLVDVWVDTC